MARRNKKLNRNKGLTFDLGGKLMADAKTSTSNNFSAGNVASSLGGIAGGLAGVVEGAAANSKINDEQVNEYEQGNKALANYQSTATTNEDLLNQWNALQKTNIDRNAIRGLSGGQVAGNIGKSTLSGMQAGSSFGLIGTAVGAIAGALAGGIGAGVGSARARKAKERLEREQDNAYNIYQSQLVNNANNIAAQTNINALANYSAYGGPIFTHGGEFSNGVTFIDNGGTHEENPMEGVPMGMSEDGIPNLVEEGEVKYNNYIFSNRLKANKELLTMLGLPKSYSNKTFSYIAKKASKESEERPNDPISKAGLENAMLKLQEAQELTRQEDVMKKQRKYAKGGKLYSGEDQDYPSFLLTDVNPIVAAKPYESSPSPSPTLSEDLHSFLEQSEFTPTAREEAIKIRQNNPELIKKTPRVSSWTPKVDNTNKDKKGNWSWLRYAPAVGAGIGALVEGLTPADYSNADSINKVTGNLSEVKAEPIGNYLTYRPFDRNYYLNKLNAQAAASRRAIMNNANGNRAAALAGILASDYNTIGQIGDLARQAEEYNFKNRIAIEDFNRGTNIFNSESKLKADIANKENDRLRLQSALYQSKMRNEIDARKSAAISANATNFITSLGNIGIDEANKADRDMLLNAGVFGTLSEKPSGWSDARWEDYKKVVRGTGYRNGGKIKTKKRVGGLTY